MNFEDINPLLTLLLGGGGATAVRAFWNGFRTWREGASANEGNVKAELTRYRRDLIRGRDYAEDLSAWLNDELGRAHYLMRTNGVDVPAPLRQKPVRQVSDDDDDTGVATR